MRPVAFDTETFLIQPGLLAPRMVCLSWATDTECGLFLREQGLGWLHKQLTDPDVLLVGANMPYDFGVACAEYPALLPLVFDAYRDGRVCCIQTQQKLIDVAGGMRKWRHMHGRVSRAEYSLAALVNLYFNEQLAKGVETWRLSFALLDGIPIERWPVAASDYAVGDAIQTLRVFREQRAQEIKTWGAQLPNAIEQQRAHWVLHLMSMWGIRAEASRVDYFIAHCEEEVAKMKEALKDTGIFRESGTRSMAEIRRRVVESFERLSMSVPMTEPSNGHPDGQVQTDKDTLEMTDDPYLHVLAESMTFAKHLGQWGPVLRAAVERPVCCRYEVLRETGRTASSGSEGQEGTNIQNPPRKGDVRPSIIPRSGWVFCSTDADTIELRAHAQNCLEMVGWSKMAERLVEQKRSKGPDLHEVLGAGIVGVDPRELQERRKAGDADMNDARQFAKIPNFGFPGGLGAPTFVSYAAGQLSREAFQKWFGANREVAVEKARVLREVWFETFPENKHYFDKVGDMINRESREGVILQCRSNRVRGGVRFTAAANGFFQGRVADAMKEILWRLAEECYTGRETTIDGRVSSKRSILYGSRPVMFLHDEPIVEHPEESASERAERQRDIVVEVLTQWMPDIPCTSSAVLMRRWQKGAEPLYVNGKLVPVKPEKTTTPDGKSKIQWVEDRIAS